MQLENILAKPEELLTEHTQEVYRVWKNLNALYRQSFEDKFWNDSLLSVIFHDFGKITGNFQNVITGQVNSYDNYIRHEFISGMFLFVNNPDYYNQNPLSLFAVFSHHKVLTQDLFSEDSHKDLVLQENVADEFVKWAKKQFPIKLVYNRNSLKYFKKPLVRIYTDYKERFLPLAKRFAEQDRVLYIWYKALLQVSDWLASGHKQMLPPLIYDTSHVIKGIARRVNKGANNKKEIRLRAFQEDSSQNGDIIAIAPTGSGKTEAALIWASLKNDRDKIIYLLPTRVTSNAIFIRLREYFGPSNVAVIHSSAYFYRKETDENYEHKEYLLDKTFFKNVSVSTIDQILTQGFNLGYWELKTFHLLNAKIIIDEIHLYEPYTLGLILATIKYLKKYFHSTFYIMTATMPEELKKLLQKYLDNPIIIEDKELLDKARNTFVVKDKYIEEDIEEILKYVKDGKKVLVVVNTVDAAIDLYEVMKKRKKDADFNLLCYHSRFTVKDRQKKEDKIYKLEEADKAGVLIATQVVEVSLDIDFDILLTENAPMDALIQRAGRVNRKRKKQNTKVIVYKHSEKAEKYIYKPVEILNRTWELLKENNGKKLTEAQLTKLVNLAYKDIKIEDNPDFKKGLKVYNEEQKHLNYVFDNLASQNTLTRLNLDSVNVIPMQNYSTEENYMELLRDKDPFEISKYELSIRRYQEQKFETQILNGFKFIDAYYDEEIGMDFRKGILPSSISL